MKIKTKRKKKAMSACMLNMIEFGDIRNFYCELVKVSKNRDIMRTTILINSLNQNFTFRLIF